MEGTPFVAPYVPINNQVCLAALEFASLTKGDVLVDLGCGDGRVLALAMELSQPPLKAIGVELDPLLADYVRKNHPNVTVIEDDFFNIDLIELNATVLVLYLLPAGLESLEKKLSEWILVNKSYRVVTVGYSIPGLTPVDIHEVDCSGSFMGGADGSKQKLFMYRSL